MKSICFRHTGFAALLASLLLPFPHALGQGLDDICPRASVGSTIPNPPNALKDKDGYIHFTARNIGTGPVDDVEPNYNYRFCLHNNDDTSLQSPVVRVSPGENVKITLSNRLKPYAGFPSTHVMAAPGTTLCAPQPANLDGNIGLTNLHFHGLNIPPVCGSDEVINTLIAPPGSGGTTDFNYSFIIPAKQPPGMYWFHPHVHGFTQQQLLGGMTGVIIVSGMEKFFPEVANLKERVLVLRDMDKPNPADNPLASPDEPWKDVSVNYVPVIWNGASSPLPSPKLSVGAGERQFWRIANASADTHFVLKLQYRYIANGVWQDQSLEILARDGVPHTDDSGSSQNGALITKRVILPPGGRVEFIMTGPSAGVEARLFSDDYNDYLLSTNKSPSRFDATDRNPPRVLAEIQTTAAVRQASSTIPLSKETLKRFTGLRKATNVRERTVIFTKSPTDFFLTLEGNVPKPFDMSSLPDIVVNMPAVEEWTVENRDNESHDFHIHQVHFRVVEINGIRTDDQTGQTMRDTIELPACRDWGTTDPNAPYANDPTFTGRNCLLPTKVKLRMDFREKDIAGTLVYHCHILEHEDKGMMAKIKLVWNPAGAALAAKRLKQGGAKALAKAEQQQRLAGVNMHASPPAQHSATRSNAEKAPGIIRTALPLPKTTGLADRFGKPIDQEICTTNSAP